MDLHATPDELWGSQASLGVQCATRACFKSLQKCPLYFTQQYYPRVPAMDRLLIPMQVGFVSV